MILIHKWSSKNESVRLVSVDDSHQIFQSFIGELIVDGEGTAGKHDLDCFASLALLVALQLLAGESWWVDRTDSWLPNPIDIELFGIAEAFSDDDLAFKQRILWHLGQIEPQPAALLIVCIKQSDRLLLQLLVLRGQIDDSSTDSLTALHWRIEVFKLLHFQLLLHDVFNYFKLFLHYLSSGVRGQIE